METEEDVHSNTHPNNTNVASVIDTAIKNVTNDGGNSNATNGKSHVEDNVNAINGNAHVVGDKNATASPLAPAGRRPLTC